jgi:hypothetical protein
MTNIFEEKEEEGLRAVAARYRSRGYDVFVRPDPELLPEAMREIRPDLLARNATESVLVEVKSQPSLRTSGHLRRIAESIEKMPGWRFELVVVNPKIDTSVPVDGNALSRQQISGRIDEAKELAASGHLQAAFVTAWIAAEAVLRRLASEFGLDAAGYSPGSLYRVLYSSGVIPKKTYEILDRVMETRNSVVHGFRVPSASMKSEFTLLCGAVAQLLAEGRSKPASTQPGSARRGRRIAEA